MVQSKSSQKSVCKHTVSPWFTLPDCLKTFTGICGLMFCCSYVEFLWSGCSQSPHLLFQCSEDTGIGTPNFSSQKPPRSTKAMLQSWVQYTEPFLSAKDTFMAFTERKMAFDTEAHYEFRRTKKLLCLAEPAFSWAVEIPSEPACKEQQRVLLDTQSSSSDGVNCQNLPWFQRNNLEELEISLNSPAAVWGLQNLITLTSKVQET